MSSLQALKTEFIRVYEGVASRRGLPTIFGRIMAVFFLEERELNQKELADLTSYSVSSVSRALDQMVRMGLVHKHKSPSGDYSVYHMSVDLGDLALSGLRAWVEQAEMNRRELEGLRKKLESARIRKGEMAEASHLDGMLKRFDEKFQLVLRVMREGIERLERLIAQKAMPL